MGLGCTGRHRGPAVNGGPNTAGAESPVNRAERIVGTAAWLQPFPSACRTCSAVGPSPGLVSDMNHNTRL